MTNTPATICIYHANCADGFGAAWVVHWFCPDVEFYAAKHGEPAPDTAGKHVLIVDFSYSLDVLQQMASTALSVLVIDHHKTAQEALAALPQLHPGSLERHQLAAVFDMNRSGAGLTWDYFYPDQPRPALINHIEDRDLWRFQLEGTREIMANLFSHPQDFEVWDGLMAMSVDTLRAEGAAIERAQQKELRDLLAATQRRMTIAGYDVPAANLPFTKASDAGNIMCAGESFAAIYWDTPEGRQFSLRSTDAGEDVSAIAKQFGGGGHRNAAGFSVPFGHELTLYDTQPSQPAASAKCKYTPGPYEVADDIINEHGNLIGVQIRKCGNGMVGRAYANCLAKKDSTVRANARLLASAPELLSALKKVTTCLKDALTGQVSAKKAGNALINAAETYEKATGEQL